MPSARAFHVSIALALIAAIAAVVALLVPEVFHDPAMTAGNARGTALVMLVINLPLLVTALALSRRSGALARRAHLLWLAALLYQVYNGVVFAFDVAFNRLFLLYVAQLSLAVWATVLVGLVLREQLPAYQAPRRGVSAFAGAYLVAMAALWAFFWLSDIVPALLANTPPAGLKGTIMPTNPFEVMDLGFTLPLAAVAGVFLIRRRSLGVVLGAPMLVFLTVEGISVAVDQWFGHLSDPSQPLGAVPIMAAMSLALMVPTIMVFGGLRAGQEADPLAEDHSHAEEAHPEHGVRRKALEPRDRGLRRARCRDVQPERRLQGEKGHGHG